MITDGTKYDCEDARALVIADIEEDADYLFLADDAQPKPKYSPLSYDFYSNFMISTTVSQLQTVQKIRCITIILLKYSLLL